MTAHQAVLAHYFAARDQPVRDLSWGIGIKRSSGGKALDVYYPFVYHNQVRDVALLWQSILDGDRFTNGMATLSDKDIQEITDESLLSQVGIDIGTPVISAVKHILASCRNTAIFDSTVVFMALSAIDQEPISVEEVYFKLHLLSYRHIKPNHLNLTGAFSLLPNIAWSNYGPILANQLPLHRLKYHCSDRPLQITHVDKFPYLVNYIVPEGVRIADGCRARLGAYLGEGTTIMPAGYVNFNAGTIGTAMVEGRISAGVVVGENSDIGGGGSIMGTLSGGGKETITVGKDCLIGANAGTGISLGDGCTIAAGVYITAGSKISCYNSQGYPVTLDGEQVEEGFNIVKGSQLSGRGNLLFIQHSVSGKLVCRPNRIVASLNTELHSNN